MLYQGSCHCGRVSFDVEGQIDGALACNCSLCSRRGSLLWFVARHKLQLKTGQEAAGTYTFNKHSIQHRYCPACGIHLYGEALDPEGNPVAAVNLRCLESIDLAAIPVRNFDGRSI
jgi:hypothetical protein